MRVKSMGEGILVKLYFRAKYNTRLDNKCEWTSIELSLQMSP